MCDRLLFVFILTAGVFTTVFSQQLWTDGRAPSQEKPDIAVRNYALFSLDTSAVKQIFKEAPMEFSVKIASSSAEIQVPDPEGTFRTFRIVQYEIMEGNASERYPNIMTLKGINVERPAETIRLDWTHFGFHAYVRSPGGSFYIDPFNRSIKDQYIVYRKKDVESPEFVCHFDDREAGFANTDEPAVKSFGSRAFGDCQFRTYRLAQATTGEYSNYHGATSPSDVALVMSAVVTVINRVNEVYERDIAVRLVLVANTEDVFFYNPATDPYSNNNGSAMLGQNQTTCDNIIGSANYDIGHVFSTGGGGVAVLNGPCNNNNKARGVTGLPNPVGDPFSIDYVSHEVGHQFGARHTQNNNCNRTAATAMEPGSASTILGYAGICNPNVQNNSDDYFHAVSIWEMTNFIAGNGGTCPQIVGMSNQQPVVDGGGNHTIPRSTPFVLSALASDADNDPLTYCWEQYDNQINFPMPPNGNSTGGPLFRSLLPKEEPERYFPNLPAVVANSNPTWEVLPNVTRNMTFRITVRDNNETAGCVANDQITISSTADAGPFVVLAPNTSESIIRGSYYRVRWDVANTNMPPVSCANVDIFLSTNGGQSFDILLAEAVENNGYAYVLMPMLTSNQCRIMVKCNDNVFYDISNQNFSLITGGQGISMGAFPAYQAICVPSEVGLEMEVIGMGGYNGSVNLSLDNAPPGVNVSFSQNPVATGSTVTVTLQGIENAGLGFVELSIRGLSGPHNVLMPLAFDLAPGGAASELNQPFDGATDVSPVPALSFNTTGSAVFFEVQLATDPDFNDLVGNFQINSSPFVPSQALSPQTVYYWRVKPIADCGPGAFTETWSFTTSACELYISTDVPVTIPDNATATVSSVLNVPTMGVVQDVNVIDLTGTHTWINDLIVRVISPSGTVVTLFNQICNNQDDFFVSFDDQATLTTLPCPPTSGLTYQPNQPLSAFIGESMTGDWILEIQDVFAEDGGQLLNWGLEICAEGLTFLPVEWLSFEAKAIPAKQGAYLQWEASFTDQSEQFEIQRSIGRADQFQTIHTIPDTRRSESETYFEYVDLPLPLNTAIYYRIKQTDFNGEFTYSPIRQVHLQGSSSWEIFPNPVSNWLFVLRNDGSEEAIPYKISDMHGRVIDGGVLAPGASQISTSMLLPGVYHIVLEEKNGSSTKRFVK